MQLWNSYKLKSYGKQIKMSGGANRLIGSFYIRLRKTGKINIGTFIECFEKYLNNKNLVRKLFLTCDNLFIV